MDITQITGDFVSLIQQGGWTAVPALLLYFIAAVFRGDWRTRREYDELARDRNEWKQISVTATEVAKGQNEQISKLTAIVESLTTSLALQRRR